MATQGFGSYHIENCAVKPTAILSLVAFLLCVVQIIDYETTLNIPIVLLTSRVAPVMYVTRLVYADIS